MNSNISFRNFLIILAVARTSVTAFNPANKPNLPVATDAIDGGLKAVTIDNENDIEDMWSSVTKMVHSKFEEHGGEDALSEETKDEIIATAVAGSVLATMVGSPVVVGAALGYAGSKVLETENGEKAREAFGQASKEVMRQANSAIDFTKHELENEKDLSKVSTKILMAIQDKAGEIQEDIKGSPQRFAEQIPALMAEKLKENMMHTVESEADKLKQNVIHTIESEEFKSIPKRSFNTFMAFMESDQVKKVKTDAMKAIKDGQSDAMKAIQDGLESEEVKALQSRASKAVKESIDSASSKITKA
mmetsp:Transcript_6181/g.15300  ORF Transcript_6181/g.15300 Transcript_6181/m.15300 type:complete len:304 (+) Transcript_6181:98-1009(+)|eukprot:CAMPEP_0197182786 /NCGR_PEP_ID=MMETSP1423-20130617/6780_1 /TAXON_ID=476441 /ORGANISM="Pseudo-nitzschia heimii, Strain UNC1101" /LENGTH=303 /DNA_ID=CAMNT_0042633273 /DNA_START=56 /DNA_END=967 /DNA_ORIENTATION=+